MGKEQFINDLRSMRATPGRIVYNQNLYPRLQPPDRVESCLAGIALIQKNGLEGVGSLMDIPPSAEDVGRFRQRYAFVAACHQAGREVLNLKPTQYPPHIFGLSTGWPLRLASKYSSSGQYGRLTAAIEALDEMDEYGNFAQTTVIEMTNSFLDRWPVYVNSPVSARPVSARLVTERASNERTVIEQPDRELTLA